MLKITVLGCGSSSGVPILGCDCKVCRSATSENKRTRVSILVQSQTTTLLIDTSPDMRAQCLREGIKRIDAIIYTHAHADHLHGIDDVRSFNYSKDGPLDTYADASTLKAIEERFGYVFLPAKPAGVAWYRPALLPKVMVPYTPLTIGDIEVLPFEQQHGQSTTLGLRFGKFAYSTDVNGLSEEALGALEGVACWLVDCLRYAPAPTHAHLQMTLGWIKQLQPERSFLTHMSHDFDYNVLLEELPSGVLPAYDGLVIEV